VEGHSPAHLGKPGENLFCAGVSVLTQTLLLTLKNRNNIEIISNQKGLLEYKICKPDIQTNIEFEFMIMGLENLKQQNIQYLSIEIRS
jgi:uncharacterized protein YsxB (DUF464 family)